MCTRLRVFVTKRLHYLVYTTDLIPIRTYEQVRCRFTHCSAMWQELVKISLRNEPLQTFLNVSRKEVY